MKKYIASILVAGAAMLMGSCDMNLEPAGVLTDDEISTVKDFSGFRTSYYVALRTLTRGMYVTYTDIQMDNFQALAPMYGNMQGEIFNGQLYSSNGDIEGVWAGVYGAIANCNYFIPKAEAAIASEQLDEYNVMRLHRYLAECRTIRAYYYYWLMDHFCDTPNEANMAKTANGVPLVTEYDPTGDRSKYPGRCDLKTLVNFINTELAEAYTEFKAYEEYTGGIDPEQSVTSTVALISPMANYINSLVVKAFQNRMQLLQGEYEAAITTAQEIITEGASYGIALGTYRNFGRIWTQDTGSEIIFMPFLNKNEAASVLSTGSYFTNANGAEARYIPSAATLSMYSEDDERFYSYFDQYNLPIEGSMVKTYVLTKYPGNSALNQTGGALINMSKPFRLAEQYLIIAESAAMLGQTTVANKYLNDLRKTRIYPFKAVDYSGQELIDQVREERNKEFLAEGFRQSDLRRWNIGFQRSNTLLYPYFSANFLQSYFVTGASTLAYLPGDHRFIWPIPSSEIEVNPQLVGQQNPGY